MAVWSIQYGDWGSMPKESSGLGSVCEILLLVGVGAKHYNSFQLHWNRVTTDWRLQVSGGFSCKWHHDNNNLVI